MPGQLVAQAQHDGRGGDDQEQRGEGEPEPAVGGVHQGDRQAPQAAGDGETGAAGAGTHGPFGESGLKFFWRADEGNLISAGHPLVSARGDGALAARRGHDGDGGERAVQVAQRAIARGGHPLGVEGLPG